MNNALPTSAHFDIIQAVYLDRRFVLNFLKDLVSPGNNKLPNLIGTYLT